jgi:hypothetical protein
LGLNPVELGRADHIAARRGLSDYGPFLIQTPTSTPDVFFILIHPTASSTAAGISAGSTCNETGRDDRITQGGPGRRRTNGKLCKIVKFAQDVTQRALEQQKQAELKERIEIDLGHTTNVAEERASSASSLAGTTLDNVRSVRTGAEQLVYGAPLDLSA